MYNILSENPVLKLVRHLCPLLFQTGYLAKNGIKIALCTVHLCLQGRLEPFELRLLKLTFAGESLLIFLG